MSKKLEDLFTQLLSNDKINLGADLDPSKNSEIVQDRYDKEMETKDYMKLHKGIVDESFKYLEKTNEFKKFWKKVFAIFFLGFISIQFIVITAAICLNIITSATIISILITGFFIETLGIVIIMVKYLFSDTAEIGTLGAIQATISSYKK